MRIQALLAGLLLFVASAGQAQEAASPNDTARLLAGLPPAAGSPLAPLAADPGWQAHARAMNASFERFDQRQLSQVRAWAKANVAARKPVLFYLFSGPDFLYANAFFPDATTYVLAGLEPPGPVPDLARVPRGSLGRSLGALRGSMSTLLAYSFFRTKGMSTDLRNSALSGTLPVLYVFLARSGQTVRETSLIRLDEVGDVQPPDKVPGARPPQGAKIVFAGPDGREKTLYYFSTNLANDGFRNGFAQFCEKLGEGDAFLKSASYLLHSTNFTQARDFLLRRSALILQDDTGIPVVAFDKTWDLKPFGRYGGPIKLFAGRGQPKLAELYRKAKPAPLGFSLGYGYRSLGSNLLLAARPSPPPASPAPSPAAAAAPGGATPPAAAAPADGSTGASTLPPAATPR